MRKKVPEINITPLVDVMLVLLVIFMVVAPVITSEISVNIPSVSAHKNDKNAIKEDIKIVISKNGQVFLNKQECDLETIKKFIHDFSKDSCIVIQADESVQYGVVFSVMDLFSSQGFNNLLLIGKNSN